MLQNVIKVTLPHGAAQEGQGLTQELIIYVDAANDFYLDGKKMATADIITALKTACAGKRDQTVFVKADEKAQYGAVIELIDNIKVIGGIEHVALATQKTVPA
jgi:biopolymer transport protein ExbD